MCDIAIETGIPVSVLQEEEEVVIVTLLEKLARRAAAQAKAGGRG